MTNSVKNLTPLEFNSRQFVQKNFDEILDSFMKYESRKLTKLFQDDALFAKLCSYLKDGNLVCFIYMQTYLNEELNNFAKEMQHYFS